MKIIFLDIDGPLNTERFMIERYEKFQTQINQKDGHNLFDPICVDNLKKIINATEAKIVISSTWRYDGLEEMKKIWAGRNLPGEVIDITPYSHEIRASGIITNVDRRGVEIKHWLDKNKNIDIESYVIIDDDSDMLSEQLSNFVKVSWKNGIEDKDVEITIKILNNK